MYWKRLLFNPLLLTPVLGLLLGNAQLGLITAGLSVLVWGMEKGIVFINLTTLLLVSLTGNINFEIIFLYVLSLAFLIRESKYFRSFDQRIVYGVIALLAILFYPFWVFLLGIIPANNLNEINIAGEILLITGFLLTLLRARKLLGDQVSLTRRLDFLLLFMAAILAIEGIFWMVPFWLAGSLLLEHYRAALDRINVIPPLLFRILVLGLVLYGLANLLPLNFLITVLIIAFFSFVFWQQERIPLLEMVYLSFILGILAGRIGLLS